MTNKEIDCLFLLICLTYIYIYIKIIIYCEDH